MYNILIRTSKLLWVIQSFYDFICADAIIGMAKGKERLFKQWWARERIPGTWTWPPPHIQEKRAAQGQWMSIIAMSLKHSAKSRLRQIDRCVVHFCFPCDQIAVKKNLRDETFVLISGLISSIMTSRALMEQNNSHHVIQETGWKEQKKRPLQNRLSKDMFPSDLLPPITTPFYQLPVIIFWVYQGINLVTQMSHDLIISKNAVIVILRVELH